jgi:hypothetical protein
VTADVGEEAEVESAQLRACPVVVVVVIEVIVAPRILSHAKLHRCSDYDDNDNDNDNDCVVR